MATTFFSGETVSVTIAINKDDGTPITNLTDYDIKMMLHNVYIDNYSVCVTKDSMTIADGSISYKFTPVQTKKLLGEVIFELKITKGDDVYINQASVLNFEGNYIKDV